MSSVNTTQTSKSELSVLSEGQMAEREKGREKQMTEMTRKKEGVGKGQDEKLGGSGFPAQTCTQATRKRPDSDCWLRSNSNTARSAATCGTTERNWAGPPTFFCCGDAGVWHRGRRPAASPLSVPAPSSFCVSAVPQRVWSHGRTRPESFT